MISDDDSRLIEHAFPLKQASLDSVHEENVRHGCFSTLHIWTTRRPLAARRAALIATRMPEPRGTPGNEKRSIEVNGRATTGDIEGFANEWAKACNMREDYWLYAAYNCATPNPRLARVHDPFGNLLAKAKGSVLVIHAQVLNAEGAHNRGTDDLYCLRCISGASSTDMTASLGRRTHNSGYIAKL